MAQAKGISSQILIDWETVFGADPGTPAAFKMPVNPPIGIAADRNMTTPETIRGIRSPAAPSHGNTDVRGPITIPIDQIAIGYWLRALLGVPATTGSDPFTHIYTVPTSIESMVIDFGFTDIVQYLKYNGVKLDGFGISIGGDGELTATLDLIGAKMTGSAVVYDAAPTEPTFTRFNQFQATLNEGGASIAYVKTVDLNIRNNLEPDSFVIGGGGIRGDLPEGFCTIEGTLTAFFQDLALLTKAIDTTESSLEAIFTSGTKTLTFKIAELDYKLTAPTVESQGGVDVALSFSGYYQDDADESAVKVTLVNGHTSYA